MDKNQVTHLQMILAVITRQAQNSFAFKGWTVVILSALFALASSGQSSIYVPLALFPTLLFWFLDAFYLRQERLFRFLYDWVRKNPEKWEADQFTMDIRPFKKKPYVQSCLVLRSKTVAGFYGPILGLVLIVSSLLFLIPTAKQEKRAVASQKKRVFVSFDYDNDLMLKALLIGQSMLSDSPFEFADWSLKEEAPQKQWEDEARRRINGCDVMIIVVGGQTDKAPGVLKEVGFAKEAGKPIHQIVGYKDSSPRPVPGAGPLYQWGWDNLEKVLAG